MAFAFNLQLTSLLLTITCFIIHEVASAGTQVKVTIPAINLTLEGTLRLPATETPVPGVVLIHGSGPNSRDSIAIGQLGMVFGFQIPVFAELGDALQERGIAVLTYDKRTCGTFNNCYENSYPFPGTNLTIDTFIEDALVAAVYLQEREEVGSVVVLGHSQSGQFIPVMLETKPDLASGIMLAGPYGPIEDLIKYQLNFILDLLEKLGVNNTAALAMEEVLGLAQLAEGLDSVLNGTYNGTSFSGASTDFWKSWSDLSERALAANVSQPVLVFNGELDTNVPPSEAEQWSDHFTQTEVTHSLKIPPCITHALNCLSESEFTQLEVNDIGTTVAPEVIDVISDFIFEYTATGSSVTSGAGRRIWSYTTIMLTSLYATSSFL